MSPRLILILLSVVVAGTALARPDTPPPATVLTAEAAAKRWARFEPDFAAFAASDRAHPPAPGGILLVGSSIFRKWTTVTEQMAPLPVLNRAFGGSQTPDQLARFAQLVPPYAPKVIVYYCGSNDINSGREPAEIAANFREFAGRVHALLPRCRLLYAAILRAPQKQARWDQVDAANTLIRNFCATDARLEFVDLNPAVFGADGQPRLDLYLDDKLHYRDAAYVAFAEILRPVLARTWESAQRDQAEVVIIGHRGASHDAPENTLAAEKLAWVQGADGIENDLQLTRDGRIIVSHDANTKRTTGRDARIADLTFTELRQFDAGAWKSAAFAGEKLPDLAEQLALLPAGKQFYIEIKTGPEIVPELKRVLAAHPHAAEQISIISFNYDSLEAVRALLPEYRTLLIAGYRRPQPDKPAPANPTFAELLAKAKAAGLSGLSLQQQWPLTAEDVRQLKAAGLLLNVWTVDDPAVARRWITLGADSLTTNRPGWLREQLHLEPIQ